MPKISIIIPVYNAEKFLKELYVCIQEQTFTDYEVLFVNDGSTDGSKEMLEKFSASNSKISLINKENGGVSSARNLGMKKAKGEYFVFWDADDKIDKDFLTEMVKNLTKENLLICGFNYVLNNITEKKLYTKKEVNFLSKNQVNDLQNAWLFNVLWNKIFDRSIIENNNISFDENVTFGEDLLFISNYLNYVKGFIVLNKTLYTYYTREGNSFGKYHANIYSTNEKIYNQIIDSLDKNQDNYLDRLEEIRLTYGKSLISSMWHYCGFIHKKGAKKELKLSLKKFNKNKLKKIPKINFLLKTLLKIKSSFLISLYYKIVLRGKK